MHDRVDNLCLICYKHIDKYKDISEEIVQEIRNY